jgi:lipopolysaccharide export system ATP-binding protein
MAVSPPKASKTTPPQKPPANNPLLLPDGTPASILARKLKKQYAGRVVVDGVSVEVHRGEVVGLLGPNGAGKTTSFYMIMGLVPSNGGTVSLGDKTITNWPMHLRARAGIGYLAQEASVFRKLSAEDNLRAVLQLMPLSRAEQNARVEQLLGEFGLLEKRRILGMRLSGGERRRVEIARTLATDPYFILLDEPFTGIDPIVRNEIQDIVLRLRDQGIGILITDHHEQATLDIVDRGYILSDGHVIAEGTSRELLADEHARRVYFGEARPERKR